ncbi:MAG: hypothetical protein ACM3ZE_12060, partial [Myxococcales bacterium]
MRTITFRGSEPAIVRVVAVALFGLFVGACGCRNGANPLVAAPVHQSFRLRLCTEAPVRLRGAPGAQQSRGCVVPFTQELSDPATVRWVGASRVQRRYLVYAPSNLAPRPVPVVLVFPGKGTSAEGVAFYDTHTRFEALADRDGFIVVYGNG